MSARDEFDRALLTPDGLAEPYPLWERMRRECPVCWSEVLRAWVVTRYQDVHDGLRDPRLSNRRTQVLIGSQLRGADPGVARDFGRMLNDTLLMKDGADHLRIRRVGTHGFTPEMLDRFSPTIRKGAGALLDGFGTSGRFDFTRDFADPFPALVIAEMFGIPEIDRRLFRRWSDEMARFFGESLGDPVADARTANAATLEMERLFASMIDRRRKEPGGDLVSAMVAAQDAGRLTPGELVGLCIVLLIAGHVTTVDQLGNAVHALLTHPDQLRRLREQPSLIKPAVEEVLRYDTSVPALFRLAVADFELGGQRIEAGQRVLVVIASANRDPEVFPCPDQFDVTRGNNRHLTFGAGPHVCLGAGLARRELEIGLSTLLERHSELSFDEQLPRRRCDSLSFRGFVSFPIQCGRSTAL